MDNSKTQEKKTQANSQPSWWRYGMAVFAVVLAAGLRGALQNWGGEVALYFPFFAAVFFVALYAGFGPGLLTIGLCIVTLLFWIEPNGKPAFFSAVQIASIPLFCILSILAVWACERLRRSALRRAEEEILRRKAEATIAGQEKTIAGQAEALRSSESLFRAIFETAVDAIVHIDEQGIMSAVNPAAEKMFGYKADEMLGHNVSMLMPSPDRENHDEYIEDYRRTGIKKIIGIGREVLGIRKDGTTFPLLLAVNEMRIGGQRMFSGIMHDITKLANAEKEIEQMLEREKAINRELDVFASIVSHDLRAPLRAVSTLANWMQTDYADKLDDEGRKNLSDMVKRVGRMDRMIEGILNYSRIGREEEKLEAVALGELVPEVVRDIVPAEHTSVKIAAGLPVVCGNSVRLRQLFQNLIGNAIKFADKSEVEIRVDWFDVGSLWEFTVADKVWERGANSLSGSRRST